MKTLRLLMTLALVARLFADDSAPKSELLPDLIAAALKNNPRLIAARARWEAAKQKVPLATAWEDPMLELGAFFPTTKGFKASEEGDHSIGFKQTFPFPGKKRLAGSVAEKEAARAYEEYQDAAVDVALGLRKTYTDLLITQKMLIINRELRGWLETAEKTIGSKIAANQAMQADLLQAQVETTLLDKDLLQWEGQRADAVTTLNRWLGRPHASALGTAEMPEEVSPPVGNVESLLTQALSNRPALRMRDREIERAQLATTLARKLRQPDFTVGVEFKHYSGDGDLREAALSLSLPLPWWNSRKYEAAVAVEQANLKSAQAEREDLRAKTAEEIHHLLTKLDVTRRTVKLYEDIIIPREKACCLAELTAYEAGQVDLFRLLDSYRRLRKAEIERYQALAEILKAQAELDALLGAPLGETK